MNGWPLVFVYVSAVPTWCVFSFFLGRAVVQIIWSATAAMSFTRWSFKCSKVNGFRKTRRPVWTYVPGEFFRNWWGFLSSHPGRITGSHPGGNWEGIGKWSVWKITDGR